MNAYNNIRASFFNKTEIDNVRYIFYNACESCELKCCRALF